MYRFLSYTPKPFIVFEYSDLLFTFILYTISEYFFRHILASNNTMIPLNSLLYFSWILFSSVPISQSIAHFRLELVINFNTHFGLQIAEKKMHFSRFSSATSISPSLAVSLSLSFSLLVVLLQQQRQLWRARQVLIDWLSSTDVALGFASLDSRLDSLGSFYALPRPPPRCICLFSIALWQATHWHRTAANCIIFT